jgi:hypothetical protein
MLHREKSVNALVVSGLVTGDMRGQAVDGLLASLIVGRSEAAPSSEPAPSSKVSRSPDARQFSERDPILEIQQDLCNSRQSVVDMLRGAPEEAWKSYVMENGHERTLLEWAFKMALEDADTLRAISTKLSEIQLIFRR